MSKTSATILAVLAAIVVVLGAAANNWTATLIGVLFLLCGAGMYVHKRV